MFVRAKGKMEQAEYNQWLESRDEHREILYGKSTELPHANPKDEDNDYVPANILAINTKMGGAIEQSYVELRRHTDMVVTEVIKSHDRLAKEGGDAIFSILDHENLNYVAQVTASTVSRWRVAYAKQGHASPFDELSDVNLEDIDYNRDDIQLIIETASAVVDVIGHGYKGRVAPMSGLLAKRGPQFAAAWIKGDIIHGYCISTNKDPEDYLSWFTPKQLTNLALGHDDPLDTALKYYETVTETLSINNIAHRLGWSTEQSEQLFTPHRRRQIATRRPENVYAEVDKIAKTAMEVLKTLSDANIARMLNIAEHEIESFLPTDTRLNITLSRDPLMAVRRIYKKHLLSLDENKEHTTLKPLPHNFESSEITHNQAIISFLRELTNNTPQAGNHIKYRAREHRISQLMPRIVASALVGDSELESQIKTPSDKEYIANLMSGVILRWEISCDKQGYESPFTGLGDKENADPSQVNMHLATETIRSITTILHLGYASTRDPKSERFMSLCRFISRYDTDFARQWVQGDIIEKYCQQNDLDSTRITSLFPVSQRKAIATDYSKPLDEFERRVTFLQQSRQLLTTIAQEEGLPLELAYKIFTDNYLATYIIKYKDPLEKLRAAVNMTATKLNPLEISRRANASIEKVQTLITPALIKRLLHGYKDPETKMHSIIRVYDKLSRQHPDIPTETIRLLSTYHSRNTDFVIQRIREEAPNRPEGVSVILWFSAIVMNPRASREYLEAGINRYKSLLNIQDTIPLEASVGTDSATKLDKFISEETDPLEVLFPNEPSDYLIRLGELADLSVEDLRELTGAFKDPDQPLSEHQQELLSRLREATQSFND